jgi:copper homeostasis protein CutC
MTVVVEACVDSVKSALAAKRGGAPRRLVHRTAGRITNMAGGKVRGANVCDVVRRSGVSEIHARCGQDDGEIRAIVAALGG